MTSNRRRRVRISVQLVDDSEDDLLLAQEAIQATGIVEVVNVSRDGVDALAYLRGLSEADPGPDLILLDLNLPRLDGFETLEAIRQDTRLRHRPVVIFSGSPREEDIRRAYCSGAATYLQKAASFPEMCAAMQLLAAYWSEGAALPGPVASPAAQSKQSYRRNN